MVAYNKYYRDCVYLPNFSCKQTNIISARPSTGCKQRNMVVLYLPKLSPEGPAPRYEHNQSHSKRPKNTSVG